MATRTQIRYEVMPRYSGGSPAMVDKATAERIADQERKAYVAYSNGWYGVEGKAKADKEGLDGIVVTSRDGRSYTDHLTGTDYGNMPYSAIRRPNQLTVSRYRSTVYVWHRRRLLLEEPVNKARSLEGVVIRTLRETYPKDIGIQDAMNLWQAREEIR